MSAGPMATCPMTSRLSSLISLPHVHTHTHTQAHALTHAHAQRCTCARLHRVLWRERLRALLCGNRLRVHMDLDCVRTAHAHRQCGHCACMCRWLHRFATMPCTVAGGCAGECREFLRDWTRRMHSLKGTLRSTHIHPPNRAAFLEAQGERARWEKGILLNRQFLSSFLLTHTHRQRSNANIHSNYMVGMHKHTHNHLQSRDARQPERGAASCQSPQPPPHCSS